MIRKILCFCTVTIMLSSISFAEETRPFTADRHKERGMKCNSCHAEEEPKTAATGESCLPCHKSIEAVAERTKDYDKNPHQNHITEVSDVECTHCHQGHKEDDILCHRCHTGMAFEKKTEPAVK